MKRRIITVLAFAVALFVLFTGTFTTAAEVPYTSYTYWSTLDNQRTEVYNRPMLSTETVLNAKKSESFAVRCCGACLSLWML